MRDCFEDLVFLFAISGCITYLGVVPGILGGFVVGLMVVYVTRLI